MSLPVVELPPGGYSFCAWMRIDSFEDPGKGLYYEPRLFSFLNKVRRNPERPFVVHCLVNSFVSLSCEIDHTERV